MTPETVCGIRVALMTMLVVGVGAPLSWVVAQTPSLDDRLGGQAAITAVVDDRRINTFCTKTDIPQRKTNLVNEICEAHQPHHSRRVGKGREHHACEAHTAWSRSSLTRTRVSTPGNPVSGGASQHNVTIDSPTQEHGLFQALVPHLTR